MLKVLNTLNLETCKDSLDAFSGIASVDNLKDDYNLVMNNIHKYDAYLSALTVKVDKNILDRALKLKVVGSPSTGTDHLDKCYMKKLNIKCFDISKEFNLINSFTATSELAFGLLLTLIRKIDIATNAVKNGLWEREKYTGIQLFNKTFGILGLGRLGNISANIANGFGMKVIACDLLDKNYKNIEKVSFDELIKKADVLSIHIHLNKENEKIINKEVFKKMKKNCILINTARGKLINEDDLIDALASNKIKGAALDLIDGEWNTDIISHKLIQYARHNSNLLISPHIGGATKESINGARVFMIKKIAKYLKSNFL